MAIREINDIRLNDKWLKATVLGSLWAAFEIIVGSLLHNLRMPFAGTFLSSFAVILLVSFYQLWKEKGIIFRAGMICAIMKSVSPSAVIFGPMIGILSEAILLELLVLLFGRNIFSYIIGGGIAVLSALIHKAVNLIILYSFDLVKVYLNMFHYAERKLNLPESSAFNLLLLLSLIYFILGAASAIIGFFIGKRANATKKTISELDKIIPVKKEIQPEGQSLYLLLLHIPALIFGLYLSSSSHPFILKISYSSAYAIICFILYKNIFRRFLKPLFWLQLIIILILASIFLNYSESEEFSFVLAIKEGLVMLFRALLVIVAFSSIGKELSNPVIKNFLINHGFQKLYLSIQIAFEIFPHIAEQNTKFRYFFKHPVQTYAALISDADQWLENLKSQFSNKY